MTRRTVQPVTGELVSETQAYLTEFWKGDGDDLTSHAKSDTIVVHMGGFDIAHYFCGCFQIFHSQPIGSYAYNKRMRIGLSNDFLYLAILYRTLR